MGTDHRLKFSAEQPIRKFHSDLMRQFRGDFSGSKTLHQMESLYTFFLMPYLFNLTHILKGGVYGTADSWLEQILFWLVFIESLIDLPFQRFSVFGTGRFFLIESIVDGVIKAVDGDNAGIYDSGFLLSEF